ncbi:hypothetical protein D3C87_1345940 [compost metagenome]
MGKHDGIDRGICTADWNREDILRDIGESLEIAHRILGVDHAGNDEQRARCLFFKPRHCLGNDFARARVVTTIDPDFRILRSDFSDFSG